MKEQRITRWDFEKELKVMAASCIGVKENTAKKKASNIFKKYYEIISHSKNDNEYYEKQYHKYKRMFDTLKSGYITYSRGGETLGVLSIKNIEQIEISKESVLIITKNGREITLASDFKYLKELF